MGEVGRQAIASAYSTTSSNIFSYKINLLGIEN